MAVNAVDSGRVRQLHAEAQDVATGLRQLSPGPEAFQPAVERLCELSRAVVKLRKAADDLEQPDAQRMWQQRARWMHEELIALTAERLQEGSPELYWDKLMSMLYHAAAESTVLMQEKEELAARVTQLEEKLAAEAPGRGGDGLSLSADAARGAAAGQEIVNQAAKDTREALELQTKLVVAQQEAQRRAADQRDTAALLQRCQGEQAAAEKLVDALQQEKLQLQHSVQHQLQVIQQLMSQSEETSSLKTDRARQLQELQLHNRTLSVNLEANARVVEKLIGLNNELMDRLNSLPSHTPTRSAGATAAAPARPKLHNPADGNFAGDVVSGNVAQCGNGVSGQVPLELGSQIERNENPTTTTASARPQDTSLTAAFERFLRQDGDDDLAPAGAARLAMVPESPALHAAGSADNSSSTTKTLFSRAADFANFVAGGRSGSEASQVLSMV